MCENSVFDALQNLLKRLHSDQCSEETRIGFLREIVLDHCLSHTYSRIVDGITNSLDTNSYNLRRLYLNLLADLLSCRLRAKDLPDDVRNRVVSSTARIGLMNRNDPLIYEGSLSVRAWLADESLCDELIMNAPIRPSLFKVLGLLGGPRVTTFLKLQLAESKRRDAQLIIARALALSGASFGSDLIIDEMNDSTSDAPYRVWCAALLCCTNNMVGVPVLRSECDVAQLSRPTRLILGRAFSSLDTVSVGANGRIADYIRDLK